MIVLRYVPCFEWNEEIRVGAILTEEGRISESACSKQEALYVLDQIIKERRIRIEDAIIVAYQIRTSDLPWKASDVEFCALYQAAAEDMAHDLVYGPDRPPTVH